MLTILNKKILLKLLKEEKIILFMIFSSDFKRIYRQTIYATPHHRTIKTDVFYSKNIGV